jgi:transglutaminase-like putative cysteine protease
VHRHGTGADGVSFRRPFGIAAGTVGLALAWLGGAAIVQLTGATAVLILLALGFVAAIVAGLLGWIALAPCRLETPIVPSLVVQGETFALRLPVRTRRPVWVDVRRDSEVIASGWSDGSTFDASAATARRGRFDEVQVRLRAAGVIGLVWWTRTAHLTIPAIHVAPRPDSGRAHVERTTTASGGERAGRAGAIAGEIDGVRPWRDGDSDKWVHWASTLRTGELVVHDRRQDADEQWLVRARFGLPEPDVEAGVVRNALEAGLRNGATVSVAVGDGEPVPIADADAAARWTAAVDLGPSSTPSAGRHWWSVGAAEPEVRSTVRARWWAAGTTALALVMLAGVLDSGPLMLGVILIGVFGGAWASARSLATGAPPPTWIRSLVGVGSLVALVVVAASTGRLEGLLQFLSGPLTQVLIVLVILHGFECRDRRSVRVGIGVSAVVVMYASAFRVDDGLVWWLVAWSVAAAISLAVLVQVPTEPRRGVDGGRFAAIVAIAAVVIVASVGVLALVPVPDGPAVLALPSMLRGESDVSLPGAIAGADGELRDDGSSDTNGDRAPAGVAGDYVGFSETMDTSVRGTLSDDVVMRVRASEPAFWRGQTFAEFDGRRWHADDDVGALLEAPVVEVPSSIGNIRLASDVDVDEFIQTYYFERELPSVVFHAERPLQVYIESDVWARPDGALRAATTLPPGSVYTVVSARPRVDAARLERQGDVADRLTPYGRAALEHYLEVPPSTTPDTIRLADDLASQTSTTYATVRAFEAWLADNVEYDLDAPRPDPGEDAVHDFLFDSRLGFCEQIASAMTVMLRTQGVPARLVTGYVPGERDAVTGVFEVRASDAHAWVEVWFPETGWQAFDPTASVPLSANAEAGTVGEELLAGLEGFLGRNVDQVLPLLAAAAAAGGCGWLLIVLRRRRERGRWGLLQDRFAEVAVRRGAPAGSPNPRLARAWTDPDAAASAANVAAELDRVAFDPAFVDDDETYHSTRKLVGSLPGAGR